MAPLKVNGEIVFVPFSIEAHRRRSATSYKVSHSNVGKGAFLEKDGKKFHTPSWIEVHPETTLDDIVVDKKPFEELFVEPKTWKFKSASSDKEYKVRLNASGKLSCDCWGYIAHRKCKHIKEVSDDRIL